MPRKPLLSGSAEKALQLRDERGDHIPDLAEVLGADVIERGVGEIGDLFLAGCAVLEHDVGVAQINLLGKIVDHLLLAFAEDDVLHILAVLRGELLRGGLDRGEGRLLRLRQVQFKGQFQGYRTWFYFLLFRVDISLCNSYSTAFGGLQGFIRCA